MNAATLIRDARARARLTQAELAERMGTTQSVIARLESPRSNPRMDTLARAIEATDQRLELTARPRGGSVDESLVAANLAAPPRERLARFAQSYASIAALTARARGG